MYNEDMDLAHKMFLLCYALVSLLGRNNSGHFDY